jgi:hypothetical protein
MKKMKRKSLGKALAWAALAALCIFLARVIFFPWPQPTLEELLDQHLLKPIPKGMTDLNALYYFNPSLGDGIFVATFKYTAGAEQELLGRLAWREIPLENTLMLKDFAKAVQLSGPIRRWQADDLRPELEISFGTNSTGVIAGHF